MDLHFYDGNMSFADPDPFFLINYYFPLEVVILIIPFSASLLDFISINLFFIDLKISMATDNKALDNMG